MGLKFTKLFSYLPGEAVSNEYFEGFLETSDEWIRQRTGISSRHFHDGTFEDLVKRACKEISLEKKESVKAVIVASCTTKYQILPLASLVAEECGLSGEILTLDINQACTGFLSGLKILEDLLKTGEHAILIGAEKFSSSLDFKDRSTVVLFGDGVAGGILEKTDERCVFKNYTRPNSEVLYYSDEKEGLEMKGKDIYRFVTRDVLNSLEEFLEENNLDKDEVTFIVHQANIRILEALSKRLELKENIPSNIQQTGNISSASIPLLLKEMDEKNQLKRGEKIVFMAFGAGLSWAFGHITW